MERIRETQWRIWSTDLCSWDEDEIRRHRTNRQFRSNPVSTCACTEASRRPSWPSYHSPIAHRWSPSQLEHTAPRCAVMTPPLVCARICLPIYPQNWKKISISPKLVSDICQCENQSQISNSTLRLLGRVGVLVAAKLPSNSRATRHVHRLDIDPRVRPLLFLVQQAVLALNLPLGITGRWKMPESKCPNALHRPRIQTNQTPHAIPWYLQQVVQIRRPWGSSPLSST